MKCSGNGLQRGSYENEMLRLVVFLKLDAGINKSRLFLFHLVRNNNIMRMPEKSYLGDSSFNNCGKWGKSL